MQQVPLDHKNSKSDSASRFPSGVAGGDSVLTVRIGAARAAFLFAAGAALGWVWEYSFEADAWNLCPPHHIGG